MRKFAFLVLPMLAIVVLQLPADTVPAKLPYLVEFDPTRDVSPPIPSPDGKEGIHIKVRFFITLNGDQVVNFGNAYKIVIEENGHRVEERKLPRPAPSEDLSVMLAIDTSGSMKDHGRMEQARVASGAFLGKLPTRADCGLILFDHEIRDKMPPIFDRQPLLQRIETTQPRGGTAYLDAASEGIAVLRGVKGGRDRTLVLVTDGIDLNSKKSIRDVVAEAKKGGVRIYTIGIGEPGKLPLVSTVLVLDHSGSMKPPADKFDTTPKIEALHQAGFRFVDSMSRKGRASIVPFSSKVDTVTPFFEKKDSASLKIQIKKLKPYGETALFDATHAAVNVLEADGTAGNRAVLAMTDGFDNSSRRRVEEVVERAKEAKIPLYMLGFGQENEIDRVTMEQMANSTGGKYYHAKNKDALLEIFENLSIQLHDDGIDEDALRQISRETGGQYFPAKNVAELKLVLAKAATSIQREPYEIIFRSKYQIADGTQRNVTLKLIREGEGGTDVVVDERTGSYQMRGLVVAEMNYVLYLVMLVLLGGLIALPSLLRRAPAA